MSFDDISKQLMRGEKIYNLPLRVCYYARVSTDSDVQINSLNNQTNYYENYIKSKQNWTFISGYIEEGITGVSVDKRISFKKMISDAMENKFDLIITKEVSRFARDLEDSIHYIRKLKEANVGVFFENQNLNTFDANSELILNIMFNLAQDESRKLSSRIKFGHRQAIKKGHVLGSSNITGYKKDNCKLIIVEEEAKFIRILYELYATGEYGFQKLSNKLNALGYKNKNGKPYDKDTLKHMIENPKYKGYYRAHVHEIMDYRTKRRKTNPIEKQVIHKCMDGSIPAIVSEELWNKANKILKNRTISYKKNNWSGGLKYPFSSKLYCKECNTKFQRSHGNKNKKRPIWCCSMYLQHNLIQCSSPIIAEIDLYNIFLTIMKRLICNKQNIINNLLNIYMNINKTTEYDIDLKLIDSKIKNIETKKMFMLDLVFNNQLSKDSLKAQFDELDNQLKKLCLKKKEIINDIKISNNNQNNLHNISKLIEEEINGGAVEEFIRLFVNEIIISKINNDRNNIKIDIYLNILGEDITTSKGAIHINGQKNSEILFLKNKKYFTIEKKRKNHIQNKFTYNVYIES